MPQGDSPPGLIPVNAGVIRDRLFIKNANQIYVRVLLKDILWLKGKGNYTIIHTKAGNEIVRAYLGEFLSTTNKHNLIRVHKSFIVNLKEIEEIKPTAVLIAGKEIPLAKSYRDKLIQHFVTFK